MVQNPQKTVLRKTTDVKQYAGCKVLDTVSEWRESMGFDKMNIKQLSRILN